MAIVFTLDIDTPEYIRPYRASACTMTTNDGHNTHKASIHLGHGYGPSTKGEEPGDIMVSATFEFTLVTGDGETPETHRDQVMCGVDSLHKRVTECACSEDWGGFLKCRVCPTTSCKTYTAKIHVGYGRGSSTMQESGDILMSVDFVFTLVTGAEETPETHREQAMRVIDELHETLKGCACAQDFWKQEPVVVL